MFVGIPPGLSRGMVFDRPDVQVLRGINLKIMKGQIVAFVDISGCGKSTMFAMLVCFYDPGRGHLALDGKGLDEMNPWEFREEVSPVQQEPKLHPGTVRENIAMGSSAKKYHQYVKATSVKPVPQPMPGISSVPYLRASTLPVEPTVFNSQAAKVSASQLPELSSEINDFLALTRELALWTLCPSE